MINVKIFLTISAIAWFIYQWVSIYRFAAKLAAFSKVIANNRKSYTYPYEIYRYIAEYRFVALITFGLTGLILMAFALLKINYEYIGYSILTLIISFFTNSVFSYKWGDIREHARKILNHNDFKKLDEKTNYKNTNETSLALEIILTIGLLPTVFFLFIIWR